MFIPYHTEIDNFNRENKPYVSPVTISRTSETLRFKCTTKYTQDVLIKENNARKIIQRLKEIQNLSDNWDGRGAVAIKKQVFNNTAKLLVILGERGINALDVDHIMPTPYGTIELDWRKDNTLLSIEIGLVKVGFFSQFPDNSNPFSDGFIFNGRKIPLELIQAINKFFPE